MPGHSSIGSGAGGIRVVKPGFRQLGSPVEPINDQRGEQSGGRGGGRRVELNGEGQTKPQRHVAPKWQLDDVSLAALVRALGPDTEQAGRRYASLRERLVRFFEWNRVPIADELADETLDRLARRLGRTETAATNENTNDLSPAEAVERPEEFAAGIARLVLYEQRRRQIRAEQAFESIERESAIDLVLAQTENSQHAEELSAVLDALHGGTDSGTAGVDWPLLRCEWPHHDRCAKTAGPGNGHFNQCPAEPGAAHPGRA